MSANKELLKGGTPMLVLKLLSKQDMYGYEIIKSLEVLSDSTFSLKEGTLYPLLHSLERDGMVKSYMEESESLRKRKYYKITQEGHKLLEKKKVEWEEYSSAVNKVLGGAW